MDKAFRPRLRAARIEAPAQPFFFPSGDPADLFVRIDLPVGFHRHIVLGKHRQALASGTGVIAKCRTAEIVQIQLQFTVFGILRRFCLFICLPSSRGMPVRQPFSPLTLRKIFHAERSGRADCHREHSNLHPAFPATSCCISMRNHGGLACFPATVRRGLLRSVSFCSEDLTPYRLRLRTRERGAKFSHTLIAVHRVHLDTSLDDARGAAVLIPQHRRMLSGQQRIQKNSYREDVRSHVGARQTELLRCRISGRTQKPRIVRLLRLNAHRGIQINQKQFPFGIHQNMFRLDVAVNKPYLMQLSQRFAKTRGQSQRPLHIHLFAAVDHLLQ